jgi:hypothetical protein
MIAKDVLEKMLAHSAEFSAEVAAKRSTQVQVPPRHGFKRKVD